MLADYEPEAPAPPPVTRRTHEAWGSPGNCWDLEEINVVAPTLDAARAALAPERVTFTCGSVDPDGTKVWHFTRRFQHRAPGAPSPWFRAWCRHCLAAERGTKNEH